MRLSETKRAATWLKQFEAEDQEHAKRLLDQIRFVPGGDVLLGLREVIENALDSGEITAPITAVPILSLEDMTGFDPEDTPNPIVFSHFNPSQPISNKPGSEAPISNLIRGIAAGSPPGTFVDVTNESRDLKDKRVRTLLFVTDYIGSGNQVIRYVETWHRNTTIRSWTSFNWVKIVVVAFAATATGKARVESCKHVDELKLIEVAPQISSTAPLEKKVEQICRNYARRHKLRSPLGYGSSAGLFACSFSVPNNLPAVLIKRANNWTPFFDGRSVTAKLERELGPSSRATNIHAILKNARQVALAARLRDGEINQRWRNQIIVLALPHYREDQLALDLGLTLPAVQEIFISLQMLGLLSTTKKRTALGQSVLDSHRRKERSRKSKISGSTESYYPKFKR